MKSDAKKETVGERQCIVTRETADRALLIRFVVSPEGVLTPDLAEKLPGRGLWVKADRAVIEQAIKKNTFSKAAKTKVKIEADMLDRLATITEQRFLGMLSLAQKSSRLTIGHDFVMKALQHKSQNAAKPKGLVIIAASASTGQKSDIIKTEVDYIEPAIALEILGAALGREQAVYILVDSKGFEEKIALEFFRFEGLKGPTISH